MWLPIKPTPPVTRTPIKQPSRQRSFAIRRLLSERG
jgi:hypothetical protein